VWIVQTGSKAEDIVGKTILEVLPGTGQASARGAAAQALEGWHFGAYGGGVRGNGTAGQACDVAGRIGTLRAPGLASREDVRTGANPQRW
jgi:hypothetical protein